MIHENSLACSTNFDYTALDSDSSETPTTETAGMVDPLEFARRLVSFIRSKDRCRVTVDCLYLALGDADLEQITMTSVAAKNSLTKAAISKRTKEIRHELHLGMNANNKSATASRRYALTNKSPLRIGQPSK